LSLLPEEHLLIEMGYLSDSERSLKFKPGGKRYQKMVSQLKQ